MKTLLRRQPLRLPKANLGFAQPETLWSPWKLEDQELLAGKQDALRLSLDDGSREGLISSAMANRRASTLRTTLC